MLPPLVGRQKPSSIRLVDEDVAELAYRPTACKQTYRLIVVRKNLRVNDPGQGRLFDDYRYFFYITNDRELTTAEIVFSANDRCHQENLLAQLYSVLALHAPADNLLSNEAYILMTSLAWNLKAWLTLRLPEQPGRQRQERQAEKQKLFKLEFRTFVNYFLRLPAQIVKSGRQLIVRLWGWNVWQSAFFRLADSLRCPQRC